MVYSKERLIKVINLVCRRTDKRRQSYISANPLMANASVDWDFATPKERAVIYHCKQALNTYFPEITPKQAKDRNQTVAVMARALNISRQKARSLLSEQAF